MSQFKKRTPIEFAETQLGAASAEFIATPASLEAVQKLCREGRTMEDAVLSIVFQAAREDSELADEFLEHFRQFLMKVGSRALGIPARRERETQDLVQSVLSEVWEGRQEAQFETRGQFMTWLAQLVRWRASDYDRRGRAAKRRLDLQASQPPEDLGVPNKGRTPLSLLGSNEDQARFSQLLSKLSERDQKILLLMRDGKSIDAIAQELDMREENARKALYRAVRRARDLMQ